MKGTLLTGLLATMLCFAPFPVAAQTGQPESGQNQVQAYREAQQQHWSKTADLRQEVLQKKYELAAMMVNPKTTEDALLKKQRELQDVRNKLEKEQLVFLYQMKQKYPEVLESSGMMGYGMGMELCGGRGYGMTGGACGMGHGMMGHGMGMGSCGMGRGMMGGAYSMGPGMTGGHHHMGPGMMGDWER